MSRNTLTSSLALPANGQAPLNGLGLNNGIGNLNGLLSHNNGSANGLNNGNGTSLPRSLPPPLDQEADQVLFQSTRGDHAVQQGLQQQGVPQGVHYILDAGPASDTGTHV